MTIAKTASRSVAFKAAKSEILTREVVTTGVSTVEEALERNADLYIFNQDSTQD